MLSGLGHEAFRVGGLLQQRSPPPEIARGKPQAISASPQGGGD